MTTRNKLHWYSDYQEKSKRPTLNPSPPGKLWFCQCLLKLVVSKKTYLLCSSKYRITFSFFSFPFKSLFFFFNLVFLSFFLLLCHRYHCKEKATALYDIRTMACFVNQLILSLLVWLDFGCISVKLFNFFKHFFSCSFHLASLLDDDDAYNTRTRLTRECMCCTRYFHSRGLV